MVRKTWFPESMACTIHCEDSHLGRLEEQSRALHSDLSELRVWGICSLYTGGLRSRVWDLPYII